MTELTPEQKITIAYMHYIRGIQQQDLAAMYNVNSGRISEACRLVGSAVDMTPPGYKQAEAAA